MRCSNEMTIKLRILLSAIALLLLAIAAMWFFVSAEVGKSLRAEHDHWSQAFIESISNASANSMIARRPDQVTDTFRRIVKSNSRVAYLAMVDLEGEIFAHTFNGPVPDFVAQQPDPADIVSRWNRQVAKLADQDIIQIDYRIYEQLKARIIVGVKQAELTMAIWDINLTILAIGLIALSLGIIAAIILSINIARPITAVSGAINAFSGGGRFRLPVFRSLDRETKQLVDSFERMVVERTDAENRRQRAEATNRDQKLKLDTAVDNMVHGLVMFDGCSPSTPMGPTRLIF
jgi:methyl-accepting chemotaxis protein